MKKDSRLDKTIGPFLVALGSLLWATDSPVRYSLTEKLSSTAIVFVEHLVGFIFSIPLVLKNYKQLYSFTKRHWFSLLFISLGGSVAATWFFTMSFSISNPTTTILVQKIQPIIAIILASFILKEKIVRKKRFWIVAIIAMVAVYFVSFGDGNFGPALVDIFNPATYLLPFTSFDSATVAGLGFALLAAFFWGGSTVFGKLMLEKVSFQFMTALRYFFATIFLFVIVLAFGIFSEVLTISGEQLLALVYLGLIPGLLALVIYYKGLKSTKASVATLCELIYPVSAALINWILLGFFLTITQVIGMAVLLGAIILLSRENAKA